MEEYQNVGLLLPRNEFRIQQKTIKRHITEPIGTGAPSIETVVQRKIARVDFKNTTKTVPVKPKVPDPMPPDIRPGPKPSIAGELNFRANRQNHVLAAT